MRRAEWRDNVISKTFIIYIQPVSVLLPWMTVLFVSLFNWSSETYSILLTTFINDAYNISAKS